MKAIRLDGKAVTEADIKGRVLVHDLGPELRKGSILRAADLARVQQAGEIHVIELEPGDVHEDEAAARLAAALTVRDVDAPHAVDAGHDRWVVRRKQQLTSVW